jgi:hypothetical protein
MFYALTKYEQSFYKDRINLFVALAPVTKLSGNTEGTLQTIS